MALTKTAQTPQASATNNAGGTTTGAWLPVNYGVSGVATITNGSTGPTVGCGFYLDIAQDGSGLNVKPWINGQVAGVTANAVEQFAFGLSPGGNGGDFSHYRVRFTGNTGQNVTVEAQAMTTTGY